jgi:hypothetical protein
MPTLPTMEHCRGTLPDIARHIVLYEKIVQGFGHQVLQRGISAFPGLHQTQT